MVGVYRLYGINISVNADIPGLPRVASSEQADLQVRLGAEPSPNVMPKGKWQEWSVSPVIAGNGKPSLIISSLGADEQWYRLRYYDGTEFTVSAGGDEIWATWPDTCTVADAIAYLTGPILGFVLRLKSRVCLHASCVLIDGQAVAFVGNSGAGKSTTAAAFARLGYPVLSDDVVPISFDDGKYVAHPGYPRLKLWPDSVELLSAHQNSSLPLPQAGARPDSRRRLDLTQAGYQFHGRQSPLAAVYVVGRRQDDPSAPRVESIAGREALLMLIGHTYANEVLEEHIRTVEFLELGRLLNQITMRLLVPHTSPDRLPELCEAVLADFSNSTTPVGNVSEV